ncbi:MAG: hypothetical protein A2148_04225 [Chloroflexi bacterium RBG_16_68_14]|nr:MAG: hypothetical protein A2148_04225 [Chloroflexi bacterium RBG_16_68_14]
MAIQALLFDLWGTLIVDSPDLSGPRAATRLRLLREAFEAGGHAFPEEAISAAFPAFLKEHDVLHAAGRDVTVAEKVELLLEQIEPGLAQRLSPEAVRAVEEAVAGAIRHHPPLPAPGAREALEETRRRGLATGLVSNTGLTPGYVLREVLADFGLLPYLQVLTFSDEARSAKPAEAIFRCTLEALGMEPADAVFIGDMPALDVVGAQAVGMWAVQVGDQHLDGVRPHARIDTLSELFPALEGLGLLGE